MKNKIAKNKIAVAFAALLGLAACASAPVSVPSGMDFGGIAPVELHAATVELRDDYHAPMVLPNVDHLFKTTPAAATRKLVAERVRAAGLDGVMRVVIEDASVVRESLTEEEKGKGFMSKGVFGAFAQEPSEKYKGRIALRLELFDPASPDIVTAHANVAANREKTLPGNLSLAERDKAFYDLTRDMLVDIAEGLREINAKTFAPGYR